jgi:UDP-N-acetylmuramoyl-tripeptide--D-alanyl-D-alanine ligase
LELSFIHVFSAAPFFAVLGSELVGVITTTDEANPTTPYVALFLFILGVVVFSCKRLFRYLRYFQQEVYYEARFLRWVLGKKKVDTRATALLLTTTVVMGAIVALYSGGDFLLSLQLKIIGLGIVGVGLLIQALREPNPRTTGKIRLAMTTRAWRIFAVAALILLSLLLFVLSAILPLISVPGVVPPLLAVSVLILFFQAPPLAIVGANLLLAPFERWNQWRYRNEAEQKLLRLKPVVIGITGSYGKTSTKVALQEVLEASLGSTFATPKSYNSLMGVSKVIRENLNEHHRYALFEMGAYHIGSIAKLCRLTHPQCGIVTYVGLAHLERHKEHGVEGIYRAKSELPHAVPKGGVLVLNGDSEGCVRMKREFSDRQVYLYGVEEGGSEEARAAIKRRELDCAASDLAYEEAGMRFIIHWRGREYQARSKIVGATAVSNLVGAFTMACALGAEPEVAAASLTGVKAVSNRLEIERAGEVTFIHDAFNSNPVGFRDALTVLKKLPAKRRIVLTPGMIELGAKQSEENQAVAAYASSFVDHFIVVGSTNREALVAGFSAAVPPRGVVHEVPTRQAAFDLLKGLQEPGDAVLIENDLPDVYEVEESF